MTSGQDEHGFDFLDALDETEVLGDLLDAQASASCASDAQTEAESPVDARPLWMRPMRALRALPWMGHPAQGARSSAEPTEQSEPR